MKFGTKAVHAGVKPDPSTGAIMTPIFQTSTYVQAAPGDHQGYAYSRSANPTRDALQRSLAALENGTEAITYASGVAATDAVLKLLRPGDEVLSTNDLYGGTYRIFMKIFEPLGIRFKYVGMQDVSAIEAAITPQTKMVWVETPTNPLMNILDIKGISEICKTRGLHLVVDNTFSSPYLQQPLDLGADIVLHSITKFINGHSDVVMGAVVVKDSDLAKRLRFIQNASGAVPGPMDCFLTLRGIKTLHLRMRQHCINGRAIAEFLQSHPKVKQVNWPGLPQHPNHHVAKSQMKDFGGMLSFTLKEDRMEDALALMSGTKLFSLAESLGGVESLIGHPASMTHASIPKAEREKAGLEDTLIRLSVGIEDPEDLIDDLKTALD